MPGPVFLEGDTVTLRPVEEEDMEFVQRVMNDPAVWRPALDVNPMNDNLTTEFFETVLTTEEDVHCLVCQEDQPVGHVSLSESRYGPTETSRARSAELAYWIAPEHHGEGYGSDAAGRMVEYAFVDRNLRRLEAHVGGFNDASAALLESLGFEHEGTQREAAWYQGEYHDMLLYGLLRSEWREDG
ncbi:GNAT family N-acetyltransferase [Haloarchaeobius amylolyticus]|uniref:GNAT family N-acetyltransferase n=1 Tax=Haloarchaeobius amylolyticus TaxID=1198296 RepID=UPI00226D8E5E|nr:GNAT family protein [Haloarchaeobius amylolyticus]